MIDRTHDLPLIRQAKVLNLSRSSVYYLPRDGEIMVAIDHRFALNRPVLLSDPDKKSFSNVSSPILACSPFKSMAPSLVSAFSWPKTPPPLREAGSSRS